MDLETPIHIATVRDIKLLTDPLAKVILHHSPNGGARPSKINKHGKRVSTAGGKLKAMGCRPGFLDLLVMWRDNTGETALRPVLRVVFVEMKSAKGVLSDDQKDFIADIDAMEINHAVARSSVEAITFLQKQGYPFRPFRVLAGGAFQIK